MKNCIWLRDWSLGFTESGLLRGHERKRKYHPSVDIFRGAGVEGDLSLGRGEFAGEERRGASDRVAGGKKGFICGLCGLL